MSFLTAVLISYVQFIPVTFPIWCFPLHFTFPWLYICTSASTIIALQAVIPHSLLAAGSILVSAYDCSRDLPLVTRTGAGQDISSLAVYISDNIFLFVLNFYCFDFYGRRGLSVTPTFTPWGGKDIFYYALVCVCVWTSAMMPKTMQDMYKIEQKWFCVSVIDLHMLVWAIIYYSFSVVIIIVFSLSVTRYTYTK